MSAGASEVCKPWSRDVLKWTTAHWSVSCAPPPSNCRSTHLEPLPDGWRLQLWQRRRNGVKHRVAAGRRPLGRVAGAATRPATSRHRDGDMPAEHPATRRGPRCHMVGVATSRSTACLLGLDGLNPANIGHQVQLASTQAKADTDVTGSAKTWRLCLSATHRCRHACRRSAKLADFMLPPLERPLAASLCWPGAVGCALSVVAVLGGCSLGAEGRRGMRGGGAPPPSWLGCVNEPVLAALRPFPRFCSTACAGAVCLPWLSLASNQLHQPNRAGLASPLCCSPGNA
jgi:hypothetical protein